MSEIKKSEETVKLGKIMSIGFIIAALIISIGTAYMYKTMKEQNLKIEEKLTEIKEQKEIGESETIKWVNENTSGKNAKVLYQEKGSQLFAVSSENDIYRLKFNFDDNDVDYVIHNDEIIFERNNTGIPD